MAAYRDKRDGKTWRYRCVVFLPGPLPPDAKGRPRSRRTARGWQVRISGTPPINSRLEAERAEREHIERVLQEATVAIYAPESLVRRNVPTLSEWFRGGAVGEEEFRGTYWKECAFSEECRPNRAGTLAEKRKVFERHIEPELGQKRLDEINRAALTAFREALTKKIGRRGAPLSAKTRANILGVLAHSLRVAADTEVIDRMPAFKIRAVPPPPIEPWTFDEYGRLLAVTMREGEPWTTAVLLAGDAGLRIGEIIALEWADLDLVANTITIARQERQGIIGPPKGGKARTVPMTPRLASHLRGVPRIHVGRVVARAGEGVGEGEAGHAIRRVCRLAGLPEHQWHRLRHSYATHAALLGANPIRLQHWLGHSTLNMTLRYIHFAEAHTWPIADEVLTAGRDILHPDRRLITQLGARPVIDRRANSVTTEKATVSSGPIPHRKFVGAAGIELARAKTSKGSGSNEA